MKTIEAMSPLVLLPKCFTCGWDSITYWIILFFLVAICLTLYHRKHIPRKWDNIKLNERLWLVIISWVILIALTFFYCLFRNQEEGLYRAWDLTIKVTGFAVAGYGLWQGAKRLGTMIEQAKTANTQAETTNKQYDLALKQDLNRQYADAVGFLGSNSDGAQLGGIYALRKLFWTKRESFLTKKEHSRLKKDVFYTLVEYVREKSWDDAEKCEKKGIIKQIRNGEKVLDIQAGKKRKIDVALLVLFRYNKDYETDMRSEFERIKIDEDGEESPIALYLAQACLANIEVYAPFNMKRAVLNEACLAHFIFNPHKDKKTGSMKGVILREAQMHKAYLREASLQYADLTGADLTGADLQGADLQGANLQGAIMEDVKFNKHTSLNDAKFMIDDIRRRPLEDLQWDDIWVFSPKVGVARKVSRKKI